MEYLDFQVNVPVFIKAKQNPLTWKGKTFIAGDYLPWQEIGIPYENVRSWYLFGYIYHNEELEKQIKVGDRLSELDSSNLTTLVDKINTIVKSKAVSTKEFNSKKCKKSRIADKQRGLIRSFLRNNLWIEEEFYNIRDDLLKD